MSRDSAVPGCLYVVATPIGNLDDITVRAVNVLKSVATIAAEDTRHTRRLLQHLGIDGVRLISLHEHNEGATAGQVLELLQHGDIALVSDAGTPLLSDPGFELVRAAWAEGLQVVPVPGASALTAALSACPLPNHDVCFAGFLPSKSGPLRKRLDTFATFPGAVVFFEAPHRIVATMEALAERFPTRRVFVARELTKMHETLLFGLPEALAPVLQQEHRGEFVVVLEGRERGEGSAGTVSGEVLLRELAGQLPPRAAARIVARICGGESRDWYSRIRELRE